MEDSKEYCLRTLRWNSNVNDGNGGVQIGIGDKTSSIIEIYVYGDDEVYYRNLGSIRAYVVFNGFAEIKSNGGNLIFANTNVNNGSLNRSLSGNIYQPIISNFF